MITNPRLTPEQLPVGWDDELLKRRDKMLAIFADSRTVTANMLAAAPALDADRFKAMAADMQGGLQQVADEIVAAFKRSRGTSVGCKTGCTWCCYQHVIVSTTELFAIALNFPDLPANRIAVVARRTASLTHRDRYAARIACPLLFAKRCSVYASRPMVCREHFSASRRDCRINHWHEGHPVPFISDGQYYGYVMQAGFDAAFWEAGFQVARFELAEGLRQALPAGQFERWARKDRPFEEAVNDDYVLALTELIKTTEV